jgi:hypothetical protein
VAHFELSSRYVESEVLPGCETRQRLVDNRPLIRAQAFGEAVEPDRLTRLAGHQAEPDVATQVAHHGATMPAFGLGALSALLDLRRTGSRFRRQRGGEVGMVPAI